MSKVDLTISCVLYNTSTEEVQRMQEQVATIPLKVHLYIIDNSPDLNPQDHTNNNITRISTGKNLGYGKAHNLAIRRSTGHSDYHLIANTDISFNGNDLVVLLSHIQKCPDIGLIAPRVVYPNGSLQHLCRLLPAPLDLVGRRFFGWSKWAVRRDEIYELRHWDYKRQADIPFISGCFMLARRSILESVHGFDERFFLYFEDLDLSRRISEISRCVFFPGVEITHQYRSKTSNNKMLIAYLICSGIRYFNKWGWFFDSYRKSVNLRTLNVISRSPPHDIATETIVSPISYAK